MRSAATEAGSTSISCSSGGAAARSATGSVAVAAEGARQPVGGAQQIVLRQPVDVGEARHLAVDHPDAGAALAARLRALDPRLVDREGEAAALLAEELGEVAAVGERALEHSLPRRLRRPAVSAPSRSFAAPGRASGSRPRSGARPRGRAPRPASESAGNDSAPAAGVVGPRERLAEMPAPAQVGGGLVGIAGDPVEQDAVRLGRHQEPTRPRPARRSAIRMSKIISEASVKRSVTATAT